MVKYRHLLLKSAKFIVNGCVLYINIMYRANKITDIYTQYHHFVVICQQITCIKYDV